MAAVSSVQASSELDWLSSSTLARRGAKDTARPDGNARLHHVVRPNADFDRLIAACSDSLSRSPSSPVRIRAYLIRASALLKKGADR